MIKHLTMVLGVLAFLATAACNTIEGAGEDVQQGGHAISKGAEKTKEAL